MLGAAFLLGFAGVVVWIALRWLEREPEPELHNVRYVCSCGYRRLERGVEFVVDVDCPYCEALVPPEVVA